MYSRWAAESSDAGFRRRPEEAGEELNAQFDAERAKSEKSLSLKVSQKGGVSLYGIRRFPITFYKERMGARPGHGDGDSRGGNGAVG